MLANKILVTGANGQLGCELRKLEKAYSSYQFFFTDLAQLDITDAAAIGEFLLTNNIDIVINCAAYTQVDLAEDEVALAEKINADAVRNLADNCKKYQATLIHISTDYVFDGSRNLPYTETEPPAPLGVYGRSKLMGEEMLIGSGCDYLIIRTSWLYSSFGHNFVKTMRRLTAERDFVNVVFDQVGTPTYAADLANAIMKIVNSGELTAKRGIYHYSNEGVCSWFDFAVEIAVQFGHKCDVRPCLSDQFPSKVKRPAYSVLDKTKIKNSFEVTIPHWRESLKDCVEILKSEEQS